MDRLPGRVARALLSPAGLLQAAALAILAALLVLLAATDVGAGPPGDVLYHALLLGSTAACLARGIARAAERLPWVLMGVSLAAWSAGDLWFTYRVAEQASPSAVTPADVLYWIFYALAAVALSLLLRARLTAPSHGRRLEGVVVGLSVAALSSAVLIQTVLTQTGLSLAQEAVALTYPLADVVLLAMVASGLALMGWRPDRCLALIGAGLAALTVADGIYLLQLAHGTYTEGGLPNGIWPVAALLIARAAFARPPRQAPAGAPAGAPPRWLILPPSAIGLGVVLLLIYDHFRPVNLLALGLAFGAMLALVARLVLAGRENLVARRALERLTARQEGLQRAATAMVAGAPSSEVLAGVARELGGLVGAARALVARLGEYGPEAVGTWADAAAVGADPLSDDALAALAATEAPAPRGVLVVPVQVGGRSWGALILAPGAGALAEDAQAVAAGFAELLALAIRDDESRGALRVSERLFRTLATNAPVGIFETDRAGGVTFVNERWAALTGLSSAETPGEDWTRALHPDDRDRVVGAWRDAMAAGGEFAAEYRLVSAAGCVTWVSGQAVPLPFEAGASRGYLGTLTDVTALKRAEEAVRRQAHVTRAVIDAVPVGIRLLDSSDREILRNAAMDRWDAERNPPSGRSIIEDAIALAGEMTDPVGYRAALEAIQADREREALDRYEIAASGRAFERYTTPVRDRDGAPLGRLFVLREVTAEDRARRATDEFVALASHELRTPLTSILGYLEIVMDGEVGELGAEQRNFLGVIDRNARRLLDLVGDLLMIARADAGRLGMEMDTVDLGEVAFESVVSARPIAEVHGIALAAETESPTVWGDRSRLGQVIDNLVSNALKFTPPGGRVTVRTHADADGAVVEVRDSGMGIPADEQDRLFERFYRTSAAEEAAIPGTGLGLAISKMIIEAHGGRIGVESEEGRGSSFLVRLPGAPVSGVAGGGIVDGRMLHAGRSG